MTDHTRIEDLHRDPENRRLHPERNLDMVREALTTLGAARSIVIDEDNVVLAGNTVRDAAEAAGITNVRIIETDGKELVAVRRSGLTAAEKRALALYDNRTAELATWDLNQLISDREAGFAMTPFWTETEEAMLLGEAVSPTWDGMPEFQQENIFAWRTLKVHFNTQEDFDAFCQAIGQTTLTDKTKWIWYPPQAEANVAHVRYADTTAEEEDAERPWTAEERIAGQRLPRR